MLAMLVQTFKETQAFTWQVTGATEIYVTATITSSTAEEDVTW